MTTQYTEERYQAIQRMVDSGESGDYACAMYSTPTNMFEQWLAGLSIDSIVDNEENNEQASQVLRGNNAGQANHEWENNSPKVNQTKGHLQGSGRVRSHSAGNIFPYIIVIVGSFVDGFSYHVAGNGQTIGSSIWGSYKRAMEHAELLLSVDL